MKTLQVYIAFNGNCEEALNFYKSAIGGDIKSISRFAEAPFPTPEEQKQKIFHSEFECEGVAFMASDAMVDRAVQIGGNVSLTISFDNEEEQTRVFNNLADGGKITMPLQDTHWNARFGMVCDKFDINWMMNCPKPA